MIYRHHYVFTQLPVKEAPKVHRGAETNKQTLTEKRLAGKRETETLKPPKREVAEVKCAN